MKRFVIIGAGAAGITAAKTLRDFCPEDIITVISTDEKVHSRCMLHKYLGHERDAEGINFVPPDFFEKNDITHLCCEEVQRIDTEKKTVYYGEDYFAPYDRLLIATGSAFFIPPIPHFREAPNVFGFRDLSDALKIDAAFAAGRRVFIVGSGLVGLDAASALCRRGAEVTIAEMAPRVMPLQTDEFAAGVYQKAFEEHGCRFLLATGASDAVVDEKGNIIEVILSSGERVACDFVIMAAGVRPRTQIALESGIAAERAIAVDDHLRTSVPDIYAAGDCTGLSGVWPDAMAQGKAAAENMAGIDTVYEKPYPFKNTCNFFGITMLSVGRLDDTEGAKILIHKTEKEYKKAILKEGKLTGFLSLGDISNSGLYLHLIKNGIDIREKQDKLFRLSFADFYGINEKNGEYVYTV
ncbi:MAG: NAD(P)/FAD-dependent oxidoreductase [Provencibacterium sp.]|jgi:nitrite reductase (NADH) large subunit|nr:NAD(P)/FAD-dependent oxidoreductase [Provencibacterium sp.]